MNEIWLPVIGFESTYEVSDMGQVRRSGKAHRAGKGRGGGAQLGRLVKQHITRFGYVHVQLWMQGKPKMKLVHRLVAEAFIGPRPRGLVVNHKDGRKTNNVPSNLEYVTSSQNNKHAYQTGLKTPHRGPNARTLSKRNPSHVIREAI